jgi:hypothetical protein
MSSKGGYILHLDGTCEGDSPPLFSCIDAVSDIVLGNKKMPSQDSKHIIPLLNTFKSNDGNPIALVHDRGNAILKAVKSVFPTVPDYICHFHFLRDIGKDLFEGEYRTIRRYTTSFKVKPALRKSVKVLKIQIDDDPDLSAQLEAYTEKDTSAAVPTARSPEVTAYLLISWVLGANSASNGFRFPFDQPHLVFHQRLQQVYPKLKKLKEKGLKALPLVALSKALTDKTLKKARARIEQKITTFNQLREAMRIACTDSELGLNDEGDDDIENIERRVKAFRDCKKWQALVAKNTGYPKMIKQIDKYWAKRFARQIQVDTPAGKIIIQPQRTNNLMEQTFRFLKCGRRRKSGQHSLNKALVGMFADTLLVRNLNNSDHMAILLKGADSLANILEISAACLNLIIYLNY